MFVAVVLCEKQQGKTKTRLYTSKVFTRNFNDVSRNLMVIETFLDLVDCNDCIIIIIIRPKKS